MKTRLEIGEAIGTYLEENNKKYLHIFDDEIEVDNIDEAIGILVDIDDGYKKWNDEEIER